MNIKFCTNLTIDQRLSLSNLFLCLGRLHWFFWTDVIFESSVENPWNRSTLLVPVVVCGTVYSVQYAKHERFDDSPWKTHQVANFTASVMLQSISSKQDDNMWNTGKHWRAIPLFHCREMTWIWPSVHTYLLCLRFARLLPVMIASSKSVTVTQEVSRVSCFSLGSKQQTSHRKHHDSVVVMMRRLRWKRNILLCVAYFSNNSGAKLWHIFYMGTSIFSIVSSLYDQPMRATNKTPVESTAVPVQF
jgi:hypothetical protein